jgi:CheY-like chemotaxis protein
VGLAVVFGILQRHNGSIDIESESGRGTTVIIHLPAMIDRQDKDQKREVKTLSRSLNVLVVDDEPSVCQVVSRYLTGDGHRVETASNGREGLEKFRAGQFDVVITDRAMPEMGGDQLASAIKQMVPGISIVMMTGFGDLMKDVGEEPEGIDFVLSKPLELSNLREVFTKITG